MVMWLILGLMYY